MLWVIRMMLMFKCFCKLMIRFFNISLVCVFSDLNGLFIKRICVLYVSVCVIVMCCCILLDNFYGYLLVVCFRLIFVRYLWVVFFFLVLVIFLFLSGKVMFCSVDIYGNIEL